jgi:hypothetical protein
MDFDGGKSMAVQTGTFLIHIWSLKFEINLTCGLSRYIASIKGTRFIESYLNFPGNKLENIGPKIDNVNSVKKKKD